MTSHNRQMITTEPLVFGVDLDGVCGDYEEAFRRCAAVIQGVDPNSLPERETFDDFSVWNMDRAQFEQTHKQAVKELRMFRHMKPMPGVSEALWRLSDAGVWIRVITHRLCVNGAHEAAVADTVAWLDDNDIPYRDIVFCGDKPDIGADMYVDDSPRNVAALRQVTGQPVIVFDAKYNRDVAGLRAESWDEVAALVLAEQARRQPQDPLPLETAS